MAIQLTHTNMARAGDTLVPANPPERGTLNTLRSLAAGLLPSSATFLSSAKSVFHTFIRATNPDVAYMTDSMEVEYRINEWVAQDPQNLENRAKAKEIIIDYLKNPSDELSLGHFNDRLSITSLPDIFSFEPFKSKLKSLGLNYTSLQSLPESIGNCTKLTYLGLAKTSIRSLPESFKNLINLSCLNLSGTSIEFLPEYIGTYKELRSLDLLDTHIQSLPESFKNLTNLWSLELSMTHIRHIPEYIGTFTELHHLGLFNTEIQSLPESIGNLINLHSLGSGGSGASYLSLPRTLQSLPNSILNLPSRVSINLTECHLSDTVLSRLREATAAPGYNGPQFHYSMQPAQAPTATPSLEEALAGIYRNAKTDPEELPNLLSADATFRNNLAMWLGRLQETADGRSANSEGFYKTILENLRLANSNADFRALFAVTIEGACATCGDRVALSVLELGVQRRLIQCDKTDLKAFAELLKGSHAINLLEQVAREKIPSLRFVDEIEVYLGYPIKLKEALNLPIDIDTMLFFSCSSLTDADLATARSFVLSFLNNQDAVAELLNGKEDWVLALKAKFPAEINRMEAQKEAALEADEPDYMAIDATYKQSLKALTLKALEPSQKRRRESLRDSDAKSARASED